MSSVTASAPKTKPRDPSGLAYALTWRLPMPIWQVLFFVVPLLFLIVITFFVVKNYRTVPGFDFINWEKVLTRGIFWKTYAYTFAMASLATVLASVLAFPAAFALSFKVSDTVRRWAVFFLIIPFFTSYLVRTFAWQVILTESGVINKAIGLIGLGPYTMLNTPIGTIVGYLTLSLPLVLILQIFAMSNIDRRYVEAAHNLGCRPFRAIFAVVIPLAKIGLIVAALFCFILSFGDFVAPYYLGGSVPPTLPIMIIDTTKSGQQWPRASVIAVIMMLTLFMIAFVAVSAAYRKPK
jgi:spermidine/putrescine transport system permease protein